MTFATAAFAEAPFASETDDGFVVQSAGVVTRHGVLSAQYDNLGNITSHVATQYGALSATNIFVPVNRSGRISPLQATRYGVLTGKVDPIIQSSGVVTKYGALSAGFGFVGQIAGTQVTQYGTLSAQMANTFPVQGTLVTKYGALYGAFDQQGLMQGSLGTRYGRITGPDRLPQGGEVITVQKRQQQFVAFVRL